MDTLRQSEDYNWDFGDEHNEENELDLSPNEATYEQMMLDGASVLSIWALWPSPCSSQKAYGGLTHLSCGIFCDLQDKLLEKEWTTRLLLCFLTPH